MKRDLVQKTKLPSTFRLIIYILIICGICLLSYIVAGADDDPNTIQNYPSEFVDDHIEQGFQAME